MSKRCVIFAAWAAAWFCGAAHAQLVCGNDQASPVMYLVDVTGASPPRTLVTGAAALCAGLAADEVGRVLYWTTGTQLYRAAYQSQGTLSPVLIGAITPQMTGLAFDTVANRLYGRSSDGLYEINVNTGATTRVFLATAQDFGGFDFDPTTNAFYVLNDSASTTLVPGRGVYRVDKPLSAPTFTKLADYPSGDIDVDGLAAGGGRLYMVNDRSDQPIYVFDLATNQYLPSRTSPFTDPQNPINAAGAWAPGMFVAGPSANLELTVTDSPDPVVPPGAPLTYTLVVRNLGPSATTGVVVSGVLPPGLTPTSVSAPGGVVGGAYAANIGALANGATTTLTITANTSSQGVLEFAPSVVSALFDPSQLNNSVLVTTTVRPPQADLRVASSGPGACQVLAGEVVTYAIELANLGPDAEPAAVLDVTLPDGATYLSAVPPLSGAGRQYRFGPVSLGSNQTRTISLSVVSGQAGPNVLRLDASGSLQDPAPGNSTLALTTILRRTPPARSPVKGIFSTLASSSSSLVPGVPGVRFSSVGGIGRVYKSESGARWIVQSDTDAPGSSDAMLLVGQGTQFQMVAREGTSPALPTLPAGTYRPFGSFDPVQGINDAGQYVFSGLDSRTDTSSDGYVAAWDGAGYRLVMQEGGPAPGVGVGVSYGASRGSATIRASGSVSFFASLAGTGITASTDQGLFINDGATLVERKGLSVPLNQAFGGVFSYKSFDSGSTPGTGFFPNAFASAWLVTANINASTSSPPPGGMDRVGIVSNFVVVQENTLLNGAGVLSPARDTSPFVGFFMEANGEHFCIGGSNDGTDWVLRNGFPVAFGNSTIAPGEGRVWTRPDGAANTFFLSRGNNFGDFIIGGFTDGNALQGWAIVLNGSRVVLRANDPIDLDNNGLFDDGVYARDVKAYSGYLSDDRYVYVVVTLRGEDAANCGGADASIGEALVRVPLDPMADPMCDPDVNLDGVADQGDVDYLINVIAGGDNPNFIDPDFNQDGVGDQGDIDALINVVAGGQCP